MSRGPALFAAALSTALSISACAPKVPDLGADEAEIVDGTRETGRPEVVLMYRIDGATCTAAIISPRVVLTANHCVAASTGRGAAPASYFRIYVGSSESSLTKEYRVSEVRQVEGPGLGSAHDLALLVLATPASETPLGLATASPTELFGQTVTAVGYGQTPSGPAGTKYTTTTSVTDYLGGFIYVEPSVCKGDSGGPLIGPDGLVYGVASFIYPADSSSTLTPCGPSPGAYNEILRHLDFIDQVLEETGTCVPDPVELCNGLDDNCDGTVDEGCAPIGEPCSAGDECVGGTCANTAIGMVCTSPCDPVRPGQGCQPGFYCSQGDGCDGWCVPGEVGIGSNDAPCTSDTDCASLHCVDPGDGTTRCLDACRADAGLCFAGEVCAAPAGACGACVPRSLVFGGRGLGEACELDEECRGDFVCHESVGIRECAGPCDMLGACGEGFECRDMLCIRDRRQGVGGVCASNADCGGGLCAAQGERHWCTVPCTAASDCPSGLDCVAAGGTMICAPIGGLLGEACDVNEDCISGLCAGSSGAARVCTAFCDARTSCAPGFECTRSPSGAEVCFAPAPAVGGGCSVSPSPRRALPWLLLLGAVALGWIVRRRR